MSYEVGDMLQHALFYHPKIFEIVAYTTLLNWSVAWCSYVDLFYLTISHAIVLAFFIFPIFISANTKVLSHLPTSFNGVYFMFNSFCFLWLSTYLFKKDEKGHAW